MIKRKLNWTAFTANDRMVAIDMLKDVINTSSGYLVNFNTFSDLAISFVIEIEEHGIENLYESISEVAMIKESRPDHLNNKSELEWWILLNLSFSHGKGNLKKVIPNVPG